MLTTILATQSTGLISNVKLYASEVESESEQTSNLESTAASEADQTEEAATVAQSEEENTQGIASQTTTDELVTSAADSQESEDTNSELQSEVSNITAKVSINKNGALAKAQMRTPTDYVADSQLAEDENLSPYENQLRITANSGKSTIDITPTSKSKSLGEELSDQKVYYVMDEDGNINAGSTKQPRSYTGNLLTVLNGKIIDSDNAIARTNGGYDTTFYVYNSIADLKAEKDGVPISGGGFDATFIETVEEDGIYYDHIKISGYEGYTQAGNIQIVPAEMIQSRSYYAAEDGDWVYYSAIDPVTSTDYEKIVIDQAPTDVNEDTKYYSDDDINYYTDEILTNAKSSRAAVTYNSYFQNLPFRSASSYTAADYKAYLSAKGKKSSEYYNETSAFTAVQSKENVNSLMMFAMANHESAYGLSSYARACNNFFGRGAVDSDPDQACLQYSYPTATDGILAQSLFLQNGYFDVLDWRYAGIHVGNKASGMNVKYASDVDWGKKIANHAYMMDQYKGGKEENKYAILKVSGTAHVYKDSELTTKIKSSSKSSSHNFYDLSQMTGTSDTVNVAALMQTSDAYQIYVPTAVKNSSSVNCSYTRSKRGSYPNYEGRSSQSVESNTANYSCDYKSYSNNKYWIKKTSATKVINNQTVPVTTKTIKEYYPNNKVKFEFKVKANNNEIMYAYKYDENGKIVNKYTYQSGTIYGKSHGSHKKEKYWVTNGIVTKSETYNAKQQTVYKYEYYSGATLSNSDTKIKYRFNMNPSNQTIKDAYQYENGKKNIRTRVYVYKPNTKYGTHVRYLLNRYDLNPDTNAVKIAYRYRTGKSADGYSKIYTYQSNTVYGKQGQRTYNDVFWLKNSKKEISYAQKYQNGKVVKKYIYQPGTIYGTHGSHFKTIYWLSGSKVTKSESFNTHNQLVYLYEYYSGATLSNTSSHVKYQFNIDPNTQYIKNAYEYKKGSSKTRTKVFQYNSQTKYGAHTKNLRLRYDLKAGTNYIDAAYQYRTGVAKDGFSKIYTYNANTVYGKQTAKTFNEVYWIKNKQKEINYSIKYKNGEYYLKHTYTSGTIYGNNHSAHISSVEYY